MLGLGTNLARNSSGVKFPANFGIGLTTLFETDARRAPYGAEVFETDRWRQNLLVLNGWFVLRFTWTMIEEQPEKVIAMVGEAIKMLTAAML